MARRRADAGGEPLTELEGLIERMARKRALLEAIMDANERGDQVEVDRLWEEVFALYPSGELVELSP